MAWKTRLFRNRPQLATVLTFFCWGCSFCSAGESGSVSPQVAPEDAKQIAGLIARLGDNDSKQRERAASQLIDFGEVVVPALTAASRSDDPEVSTRATALLQRLNAATLPTLVSIQLRNATAAEVLDQLAQQAAISFQVEDPVVVRRLQQTRMSLHAERRALWDVLLEIGEAADVRPMAISDDGRTLSLGDDQSTWSRDVTSVSGPFAVHCSTVTRRNFIPFGAANPKADAEASSDTELHLFALAENKTHAQRCGNVQVSLCIDENGTPLTTKCEAADVKFANGSAAIHIAVQRGKARRIASIEGTVEYHMEVRHAQIKIPRFLQARNVDQTAGGIRLRVRDARRTSDTDWAVRISVYRDGRDEKEWNELKQRIVNAPPMLQDASRSNLDAWETPAVSDSGESTQIEFSYTDRLDRGSGRPGEPVRLVWDLPISVREVTVPFRFTNIPLP